tara:strand:- start:274 stop:657 length:384 start_codon:yes stop_codon:yes gene_type:complete
MKNVKRSTNKEFGIVFSIFFFLVFVFLFFKSGQISFLLLTFSLFILILGLINSPILTPFNILWFKFGLFLGKIISPVIIGILFFGVVTPISLIMKVFKKDLLNLKFSDKETYWQTRPKLKNNMKKQF